MDRRIQTLIQKGYPLEIINYLQDNSKDEVNTAVEKLMKDISVNNIPTDSPNVYFIGGQPGSGKSALMNRIRLTESVNGIVNIQMDEYRMMNPKIEEIEQYILEFNKNKENRTEAMSRDLVALTQSFADAVEEKLIQEVFKKGYNICLESTLKNPYAKLRLAANFHKENPNVKISVIMLGVSKEVALLGTIVRAEQTDECIAKTVEEAKSRDIKLDLLSRGTVDIEFYNRVCSELPKSIGILSDQQYSKLFNGNVCIEGRDGYIYYNRNQNSHNIDAATILENILYGDIAKYQKEAYDLEPTNYYAIDAFIAENKELLKKIYGSVKNAEIILKKSGLDVQLVK